MNLHGVFDHEVGGGGDESGRVREAVAANMRRARLVRGMSLRELAAGTGLSSALLSQIERGTANPTVAALTRIAQSIDLTFGELTRAAITEPRVVRAIPGKPDTARARMLFTMMERRRFDISEGELPANQAGVFSDHGRGSVEYGYVVSGSVSVTIGDSVHLLDQGDAIQFSAALPHSYSTGPEPATVLTVVSYSDEP